MYKHQRHTLAMSHRWSKGQFELQTIWSIDVARLLSIPPDSRSHWELASHTTNAFRQIIIWCQGAPFLFWKNRYKNINFWPNIKSIAKVSYHKSLSVRHKLCFMFWLSFLSLLSFLSFLSPTFIVPPAFPVLLTETHDQSILDSGMRIKDILMEIPSPPRPRMSILSSWCTYEVQKMTMITFQKSEQHFSRFPVLYPFSEHSGMIQYHVTKYEDKNSLYQCFFQLCIVPFAQGLMRWSCP